MNPPATTISVITPSYNQGEFIGRTLASVASQSHPAHEHLVFDGGSTDATLDVLRRAGAGVHWVSRPDRGQADAVNQGLVAASGEVIGWINSDDIYYPDTLARVASAFERHPDIDVIYGKADHIDIHDRAFEPYPTTFWDPQLLRHTCFICQPALFFRRRVIERVGLLDAGLQYCMDYNYWLRLADAGCRFSYLPYRLAGSRLYATNKTLHDRVAVHREIADMFQRYQGSVPLRWVYACAHYSTAERINRDRNPLRYTFALYLQTMRFQWLWNHRLGLSALRQLRRDSRNHAQLEAAASS
jgi:glycosyltransferase involved in cell wall biosynthesis